MTWPPCPYCQRELVPHQQSIDGDVVGFRCACHKAAQGDGCEAQQRIADLVVLAKYGKADPIPS